MTRWLKWWGPAAEPEAVVDLDVEAELAWARWRAATKAFHDACAVPRAVSLWGEPVGESGVTELRREQALASTYREMDAAKRAWESLVERAKGGGR